MRDALIAEYSAMWDEWGDKAMDKLWDTYCINGWDCWSIGLFALHANDAIAAGAGGVAQADPQVSRVSELYQ